MELNDIKNLWDTETVDAPEISVEKQKEIHMPLEKIRYNMRMEFWMTVGIFVPMLFLLWFYIGNIKVRIYTVTLVFTMILVTGFYFKKFFLFYKELANISLSTKDSLKDLTHQFELNKQYYISYYIAFAPFLVCETLIVSEFGSGHYKISQSEPLMVFIIATILGLFLLYFVGIWWFQEYYGKHIRKVTHAAKDIIPTIKTVETEPRKQFKLYDDTELFFSDKFGKWGSAINTLVWLLLGILIFMVLSFVAGYIVGYLGFKIKN